MANPSQNTIHQHMKKYFLFLLQTLVFPAGLLAQHYNNIPFDLAHQKFTGDGGMLSLVAEKSLLELREVTLLTVRINWPNDDAASPFPEQFDYRFQDPSKAPWKISAWKIIEGTGELKPGGEGNYFAAYDAPDKMPAGKHATVSVTLMPVDPAKPKVELLQTIYLADNETVFYFDCPYLHINQEKYVVKNNGGALAASDASARKAVDQNNAAMQQASVYYQKAIEAGIKTDASGFNLDALTSNAKAIYAKDEDVTTLTINDDKVAMVSGRESTSRRMYNIVISFPGKTTGTFKIKSNKKITASIILPQVLSGIGCACSDDPTDPNHTPPTCSGGTIRITRYDGKFIEGSIYASLEAQDGTQNPPPTFYGTLNGKFRVPVANITH